MPTKNNSKATSEILQKPLTENGENVDFNLSNTSKNHFPIRDIDITKQNLHAQESLSLTLTSDINLKAKNLKALDIDSKLLDSNLAQSKKMTGEKTILNAPMNISLSMEREKLDIKPSLESPKDIEVILALHKLQQESKIAITQHSKQQMHKATINNKLISSLSTPVFMPNNTKKQIKSQQSLNPSKKPVTPKTNKISRAYRLANKFLFSPITWLIVVITIIIGGYKFLRDGISVENLSFGNIHIQHIFLQLNEKLVLEIDKIDISALESNPKDEYQNIIETLRQSADYIQRTLYALSYFEKLKINNIALPNSKRMSLYYDSMKYKLDTPLFHSNLSIKDNKNNIQLTINDFYFKNFPIQINGNIAYMIPKNELDFDFGIILESKQILNANGTTNFKNIDLNASSIKLKNLNPIKPYVDGIENESLRKTLQNWLYNQIEYDSLQLTRFKTSIDISNIAQSLLDNTKANIVVKNAAVTLNPGVEPIYSPHVDIEFDRTNLKITPMHATFANMNLHGSEVLIANMPTSNIYISLNGSNVRLDSNLNKLLQSYDVFVPVMQESLKLSQSKNVSKNKNPVPMAIEKTIQKTEHIVTQAINKNPTSNPQNINDKEPISADLEYTQNSNTSAKKLKQNEQANKNASLLYDKILELNPNTNLTSQSILNTQTTNNESSLHLKIAIERDKKNMVKYLFSLQGVVQAKSTFLSLFDIPLEAQQINVALDIAPDESFVYVNGTKVKWKGIFNADVNVQLDLHKKKLKANTYIHEARLHSKNIYILDNQPKKIALHEDGNFNNKDRKLTSQHKYNKNANHGIYSSNTKDIIQHGPIQKALKQYGYRINQVAQNIAIDEKKNKNAKELQSQNVSPADSIPNIEKMSADTSKQGNNEAKNDEYVLKELRNNPVWDKLKIKTKKTREFKKLSHKELEDLAIEQIRIDEEGVSLEHDFLRINNTNINLSLTFQGDLLLNVPALSLSLIQKSSGLNIKVDNIEKILKFSPLARYYGLKHGSFNLNVPYNDSNQKDNKNNQNTNKNDKQSNNKARVVQNSQDKNIAKNSSQKQNIQSTQTLTRSGTSTHIIFDSQNQTSSQNPNSQSLKNEESSNKESNDKISNLDSNNKQNNKSIDAEFTLNLTQLEYPIYTISHQKVIFLTLKGKIKNGALTITANKNIDFKSKDSLSMLRVNGYRINVDELYKSKIPFFVELLKNNKKETLPYSEAEIRQELELIAIKNKLRKMMKINAVDFNILGENLQITFLGYTAPFDSFTVRFVDGKIMVDGQYGNGILNANIIKDNINIRAKNFSGDFLNTVLTSTKDGKKILDGGIFSVDLIYRGQILNGSAEIQNTSLTNFKAVQNIFALIDAVPSLFMFKNPHITTRGYQISYGKILFAMNEDYIGLQNIFLLGNSMDINGWGIIDKDSQEMNMNLNISTIKNLSKFINKIPIIGYLILGSEGKINTNLILTGKYSDPNIHITLAADIIKAPFNILRRIFTPVDLSTNRISNDEALY